MILNTSDSTFKTDVIESDIPVLVDFWAPWCEPCKKMEPILYSLKIKANNKVKIMKLNVDENPETGFTYVICSIPMVVIFQNGKNLNRLFGVQPQTVYEEAWDYSFRREYMSMYEYLL